MQTCCPQVLYLKKGECINVCNVLELSLLGHWNWKSRQWWIYCRVVFLWTIIIALELWDAEFSFFGQNKKRKWCIFYDTQITQWAHMTNMLIHLLIHLIISWTHNLFIIAMKMLTFKSNWNLKTHYCNNSHGKIYYLIMLKIC